MTTRRLPLAALALVLGVVSCAAVDHADADQPAATRSSGIDSTVEALDAQGSTVAITYTDVTGVDRTIRAQLRLPADPGDLALPVVVWSHGGSRGSMRVDRVGDRWGQAMTRAGHAAVAIAHTGRSDASRSAVCDAVVADDCSTFNTLFWDRPHDLAVTLDWVESIAVERGLDPSLIVYGGHSAGATGALTVAGMDWVFGSDRRPPTDPRPVAFIAASPPGASARGIDAEVLADVDRPLLLITGRGDSTGSTAADDRLALIDRLPVDAPSIAVWIDRAEARHGVFDLNTAPCRRAGGSRSGCRTLASTIARIGTEFVDAVASPTDLGFDEDALRDRLGGRLPDWAELR